MDNYYMPISKCEKSTIKVSQNCPIYYIDEKTTFERKGRKK